MKVKAADEAKVCIRKRKVFRYNGVRSHKSKSAEGCYGVFARNAGMTIMMAVYEPQTGKWFTTRSLLAHLQQLRLDLPEADIFWMDANGIALQDIYKNGYPLVAQARIMGRL